MEAINKAGYIPGKDICIALDVAASELYNKESKTYHIDKREYPLLIGVGEFGFLLYGSERKIIYRRGMPTRIGKL